jgi:hypothetical protein
MSLIVEDGSGMEDAESYVSVADFKARLDKLGHSYADFSDAEIESALRRGTAYIDAKYRSAFPGTPTLGREQALEWPREDVYTAISVEIDDDEMPRELIKATIEASRRELTSPGSLTPDYVETDRVVSETVGPLSVTYQNSTGASDARPVITEIDEILAPILTRPQTGSYGFLQRA